ncbi:MAG: Bug family tripartite tricarboxylate transporter substrate binding protein [Xanthobacteraceae bacterium]
MSSRRTCIPAEAGYFFGAFIGAIQLGILVCGEAAAQSGAALYAGKQIRMVISSGVGGGYDAYARALARYIGKYIPGNPGIVAQNMPGASGITATNWAYSVAPRDGTVILATYNALLAEPLYGNPSARFDPLKLVSIGSISGQQNICATWHSSPIKTIAQTMDREVTVAATGATGNSATLPKILNGMLGTKFKVILGYSTTGSRLAVERGEVDGVCGLSYSTLKASNPDWIRNKRINVLLQTGSKPQQGLAKVPLVVDLVTDPENRKVIALLGFAEEIGRPFMMPPDTPKEMVAVIRRAFDATLKDPNFLADAEKAMLEVDPVTGEEMEQILKNAYAAPKSLIQKAAEYTASGAR